MVSMVYHHIFRPYSPRRHDRYGVVAEILTSSPSLAPFNLIRTINKAPQLYVIIVNARGFHVPGNE